MPKKFISLYAAQESRKQACGYLLIFLFALPIPSIDSSQKNISFQSLSHVYTYCGNESADTKDYKNNPPYLDFFHLKFYSPNSISRRIEKFFNRIKKYPPCICQFANLRLLIREATPAHLICRRFHICKQPAHLMRRHLHIYPFKK